MFISGALGNSINLLAHSSDALVGSTTGEQQMNIRFTRIPESFQRSKSSRQLSSLAIALGRIRTELSETDAGNTAHRAADTSGYQYLNLHIGESLPPSPLQTEAPSTVAPLTIHNEEGEVVADGFASIFVDLMAGNINFFIELTQEEVIRTFEGTIGITSDEDLLIEGSLLVESLAGTGGAKGDATGLQRGLLYFGQGGWVIPAGISPFLEEESIIFLPSDDGFEEGITEMFSDAGDCIALRCTAIKALVIIVVVVVVVSAWWVFGWMFRWLDRWHPDSSRLVSRTLPARNRLAIQTSGEPGTLAVTGRVRTCLVLA